MQTGKIPLRGSTMTSPKLLAVITLAIAVHIASIIIAVFLTCISVIAYRRDGGAKLFFMMGGFAILAFVEFLYLFYSTVNIETILIPIVNIELSHVILLGMLTMFGIGVLKVNR
jgi:hypothetical protein